MRHFVLLTFTLVVLTACGQNNFSEVTVIFENNQNPNFTITIDTLLKKKEIDFSTTPIDISFVSRNFHLPYYVPTAGIFKNAAKDKECDMKMYPASVKCYEYDDKKRVAKMTVNGSGTMNNFIYLYNHKNQIIQITNGGTKFTLKYNADGTLSELRQSDGVVNRKLVLVYE